MGTILLFVQFQLDRALDQRLPAVRVYKYMLQKIFYIIVSKFLKNAQKHNGGSVSAIKGQE